jgi:hypothetical protein
MPKEACRIKLKITDIRVERLQDISQNDAINEGLNFIGNGKIGNPIIYEDYLAIGAKFKHSTNNIRFTAIDSYKSLWIKINGKDSWNINPWVWVIQFERI